MRTRSERHFTADDYALFAAYRPRRALVEPAKCNHDPEHCWVECGPPAITRSGQCRACGAYPRALSERAGQ
jgi:hypothetical protein